MTRRQHLQHLTSGLLLAGCGRRMGAAPPPDPTRPSVLVIGGSMMNGPHFSAQSLPVMRDHFDGCRRVALVLHATHPSERDRMAARLAGAFAHLGVGVAESLHRREAAAGRDLLAEADGIFVGGGETFALLAELYRTGQLALMRERVRAGVPYGGSSAGANVAGRVIGTTNDFPVADVPSRAALGLLPVTINPHHPLPEQPEFGARADKIGIYLQFNPAEFVLGVANNSHVRRHAGVVRLAAGRAWLYRTGGRRELKVGEPVPELVG